MFGIDDALWAALLANGAEGLGGLGTYTAALTPELLGGTLGSTAAGLGGATAAGTGASLLGAQPAFTGLGKLYADASLAGGALPQGVGTAGLGFSGTFNPTLAQIAAGAPANFDGLGVRAPLDYWKLMQYMNAANLGLMGGQGSSTNSMSTPPIYRQRQAGSIAPVNTQGITPYDINRYPYNTRLSLLGRR